MATAPRQRAARPSAEDDFYVQEDPRQRQQAAGRDEGQDDPRRQSDPGPGEAEDAPLDPDQEQETGNEENLEPGEGEDDDFFDTRPPSRGQHRQQSLANENRDLRRELDDLRRRQPSGQTVAPGPQTPPRETDDQFEARIQLLSPEERMEARYRRDREAQNAQFAFMQFQQANTTDRAAFQARAAKDARFARWEGRVEAEFTRRQQMGQLVSRMDILKWMIGDRIVDGDEAPTRRERARAQERVSRQTTRPMNTGSDVRPARRGQLSEREARARRLENIQI